MVQVKIVAYKKHKRPDQFNYWITGLQSVLRQHSDVRVTGVDWDESKAMFMISLSVPPTTDDGGFAALQSLAAQQALLAQHQGGQPSYIAASGGLGDRDVYAVLGMQSSGAPSGSGAPGGQMPLGFAGGLPGGLTVLGGGSGFGGLQGIGPGGLGGYGGLGLQGSGGGGQGMHTLMGGQGPGEDGGVGSLGSHLFTVSGVGGLSGQLISAMHQGHGGYLTYPLQGLPGHMEGQGVDDGVGREAREGDMQGAPGADDGARMDGVQAAAEGMAAHMHAVQQVQVPQPGEGQVGMQMAHHMTGMTDGQHAANMQVLMMQQQGLAGMQGLGPPPSQHPGDGGDGSGAQQHQQLQQQPLVGGQPGQMGADGAGGAVGHEAGGVPAGMGA